MSPQQLILILAARWRMIAAVFVGIAAIGTLLAFVLPRAYTASVDLVVDPKAADAVFGGLLPPQLVSSYIRTQTDIIVSRHVLERAAARPEVARDETLLAQWREATEERIPFPVWFGKALKRDLVVEPGRDSNMLVLSYQCPAAEQCARVANAVASAYIETNLEMKVGPAQHYAEWFDARTKGMREAVEAAQRRLSAYQRAHGIVASDERLDVETARLEELSRQLTTAQTQRSTSRSRSGNTGSAELVPEVVQSALITGLKGELARLEAQRAQLASRLGPNHPELRRINSEVASVQGRIAIETRRIVGSIDTADQINAAHEAEMRAAVEAQKQRVLALKAQRDEVAVLQKDVENAQRNYELVTGRLTESSLQSQAQQTNVLVLTPAAPPTSPSWPRRELMVLLSMALGLLLGLSLALGLELLRRRIRSEADVVEALGVPVLSVVPRAVVTPNRPLLTGPR